MQRHPNIDSARPSTGWARRLPSRSLALAVLFTILLAAKDHVRAQKESAAAQETRPGRPSIADRDLRAGDVLVLDEILGPTETHTPLNIDWTGDRSSNGAGRSEKRGKERPTPGSSALESGRRDRGVASDPIAEGFEARMTQIAGGGRP